MTADGGHRTTVKDHMSKPLWRRALGNCPFPGCDGQGHLSKHFQSHSTITGCPMAAAASAAAASAAEGARAITDRAAPQGPPVARGGGLHGTATRKFTVQLANTKRSLRIHLHVAATAGELFAALARRLAGAPALAQSFGLGRLVELQVFSPDGGGYFDLDDGDRLSEHLDPEERLVAQFSNARAGQCCAKR